MRLFRTIRKRLFWRRRLTEMRGLNQRQRYAVMGFLKGVSDYAGQDEIRERLSIVVNYKDRQLARLMREDKRLTNLAHGWPAFVPVRWGMLGLMPHTPCPEHIIKDWYGRGYYDGPSVDAPPTRDRNAIED